MTSWVDSHCGEREPREFSFLQLSLLLVIFTELVTQHIQWNAQQGRSVFQIRVIGRSLIAQFNTERLQHAFCPLLRITTLELFQNAAKIFLLKGLSDGGPAANEVARIVLQHFIAAIGGDAFESHLRCDGTGDQQEPIAHMWTTPALAGRCQVQVDRQQVSKIRHTSHLRGQSCH